VDEYGVNKTDEKGNPIPVPSAERLRERSGRGGGSWNGIRQAVPKDLDLGEVRYALGFLYWKQDAYPHCAAALAPFVSEPALRDNKHRDQALFMAAQSYYRLNDYAHGTPIMLTLLREYPHFEAIEEAYVLAARGCVEIKKWSDLDLLYLQFIHEWGKSDRRPRMDLYSALGKIGSGKATEGGTMLLSIARSDTYEDVKADAYYHLGLATLIVYPDHTATAYEYLTRSVTTFARDGACLEAGKLAIKLRKWEDARQYLERVGRDFPNASPENVQHAKALLPEVLKQIVKPKQ
jgi:TolA-binding protein